MSKAKPIPITPNRVIVDSRERKGIFEAVAAYSIAHPEPLALPVGDFWIRRRDGGLVVVEHKYHDISLDWPTRLPTQIARCRAGADEVVLLVEDIHPHLDNGKLISGRKIRGVYYDQIWSWVYRQQVEWGLRVYQCGEGEEDVARAVRAIFKYYRRKE